MSSERLISFLASSYPRISGRFPPTSGESESLPSENAPAPAKPAPEAKPAPAPAPEKKAEEKVTGDSVLFSLKNEKEEKNVPTAELEFGKNK